MRKYLRLLIILVFPVAALRVADLLLYIDFETGFANKGSIYLRIAACLVIIFIGYLAKAVRKRSLLETENDLESTNGSIERSSIPAGISFFLAGLSTAVASVGSIYLMFASGEIYFLQKSSEELLSLGRSKPYYIVLVLSTLIGVFVAFWFMLIGSWHFRGEGHFSGGRFISIIVAVWYYLRIIKEFLKFPINPSNITSLAMLLSVLALAMFYTKFAKAVSINFPLADDPSLFGFGGLAFLLVLGIGTPTLLIFLDQGKIDQIIIIIADFFAAVAALAAIYTRLVAKEKKEN